MKNNQEVNNEVKPDALEQAKAEMTVKKIQEILDENNMEIQAVLEGYPFMLRPVMRIVPKKVNPVAPEVHEDKVAN